MMGGACYKKDIPSMQYTYQLNKHRSDISKSGTKSKGFEKLQNPIPTNLHAKLNQSVNFFEN